MLADQAPKQNNTERLFTHMSQPAEVTEGYIVQLFKEISALFPGFRQPTNDSERFAWRRLFSGISLNVTRAALDYYVKTGAVTPPTPGQLVRIVAEWELKTRGIPTPAKAWHLIRKAARNGVSDPVGEFNKLPEIVQDCIAAPSYIQDMGRGNYKDLSAEHRLFLEAYNKMLEEEITQIALTEDSRQEILRFLL